MTTTSIKSMPTLNKLLEGVDAEKSASILSQLFSRHKLVVSKYNPYDAKKVSSVAQAIRYMSKQTTRYALPLISPKADVVSTVQKLEEVISFEGFSGRIVVSDGIISIAIRTGLRTIRYSERYNPADFAKWVGFAFKNADRLADAIAECNAAKRLK